MALPGFEDKQPGKVSVKLAAIRDRVIEELKRHPKEQPIKSAVFREQLRKLYGVEVTDGELRMYLRMLYMEERQPVGSYGDGFYWGQCRGDMDLSIAHRKGRITSLEKTVLCLEQINRSLPERPPIKPKAKPKYPLNQPELFDFAGQIDTCNTGDGNAAQENSAL